MTRINEVIWDRYTGCVTYWPLGDYAVGCNFSEWFVPGRCETWTEEYERAEREVANETEPQT